MSGWHIDFIAAANRMSVRALQLAVCRFASSHEENGG
jgi:hypothetical protein